MLFASAAAAALTGCGTVSAIEAQTGPSTPPVVPTADMVASPTPDVAQTLATLETLPVKGRASKTGYTRDEFGQAWSDDVTVAGGHNGCDTRNDILGRDLIDRTYKDGTKNCVILTGTLNDPYTGKTIAFTRGKDTSSSVQIDHVVALSDAWQKGAQQLDDTTRRNLANDPRNLLAADGPANQQKSDGDAATWLPANKSFRCVYVAKQVEVKAAYQLWVTQAEKDAIARVLSACG
ncbi:HNH endonuclease [Rhodococcus sp. WS4]|nr:HNH endonuclease [Rhodococcus sp. WS4]